MTSLKKKVTKTGNKAFSSALTESLKASGEKPSALTIQRIAPDERVVNGKTIWISNLKDKAEPITRHPAMKELPIALQEGRYIVIAIGPDEGVWFELA